jgi:quercetin dioxygenase-like cupin family protein
MRPKLLLSILFFATQSFAVAADPPAVRAAVLMTKALEGVAGKEAIVLTVELAPSAESPPHRHNANTFVYVLEGSIVMQVKGSEPVTISEGQTFYELPTDTHTMSKNASSTTPAKFVVFMVKETGAPVSVPAD